MEEAYREGKELMGRSKRRLGVLTPGGPEGARFRSFFGASVVVVLTAWHGMAEHDLLLDRPGFKHYLWALLFMAVYPKSEAALCAHLGGCDPKTARAFQSVDMSINWWVQNRTLSKTFISCATS